MATLQGTPLGCCPHYLIPIIVLCVKLVSDMGVDGNVPRQCTAPLALLRRGVAVLAFLLSCLCLTWVWADNVLVKCVTIRSPFTPLSVVDRNT